MNILYNKAKDALENAYAPYSNFQVGAAIELHNGEIHIGANVENVSFGLTNCAERSAIFSVYSKGFRKEDIKALLVIGNTKEPIIPCGACLQVMSELLNSDTKIFLANTKEKIRETNMKELLPVSFSEVE